MSDAEYRWVCARLRSVSTFWLGTSLEEDRGFLRYCRIHVEVDGPGALFTPDQVDRLQRLGHRLIGETLQVGSMRCFEGREIVPPIPPIPRSAKTGGQR